MEYPYTENHIRYATVDTHISQIAIGDTVLFNGVLKTVGHGNIKRCSFMGLMLFGDSFQSGNQPVKKAIIQHVKNQ